MTIAKLETGQRKAPSSEHLRALSRALRVSMPALLGSTNPATDRALADYEASAYHQQFVTEGTPILDPEREFLRLMIESMWPEGRPNPKALHHFHIGYRLSPELQDDEFI